MEIALHVGLVLIGFVCLIGGAELLVRGGSGIARSLGISPMVVGLTIIAYGTSMPEFMASCVAMMKGVPGLALGNVLGSNIFNIAIVLGVISLMQPIEIEREIISVQIPVLLLIMVWVFVFGLTGNAFSLAEGVFLFLGVISYTVLSFYRAKPKIEPSDLDTSDFWANNRLLSVGIIIAGCILLFLGGKWVVDSSIFIAEQAGLPPRVIGATLVAIGTSLPELITSIIGILRKETEIGIGNAIGSCVFNLLMVIGGSAMVREISCNWMNYRYELGFSFLSAIILWLLVRKRRLLKRKHGLILVSVYIIFSILILI